MKGFCGRGACRGWGELWPCCFGEREKEFGLKEGEVGTVRSGSPLPHVPLQCKLINGFIFMCFFKWKIKFNFVYMGKPQRHGVAKRGTI